MSTDKSVQVFGPGFPNRTVWGLEWARGSQGMDGGWGLNETLANSPWYVVCLEVNKKKREPGRLNVYLIWENDAKWLLMYRSEKVLIPFSLQTANTLSNRAGRNGWFWHIGIHVWIYLFALRFVNCNLAAGAGLEKKIAEGDDTLTAAAFDCSHKGFSLTVVLPPFP